MTCIYKSGAIEIWQAFESHGFEFYVYGIRADPIVCPSKGMAFEFAGA